jgi:hypothetical protein
VRAAGSDGGNDSHPNARAVTIAANHTGIHCIHFADGAWQADGGDANGVQAPSRATQSESPSAA